MTSGQRGIMFRWHNHLNKHVKNPREYRSTVAIYGEWEWATDRGYYMDSSNVHKWYIGSLASFIAMATCYQEWTYDMAVRPCAWHYIDLPSSPLSRAPISATSAHQWLCDPRCSWHAIPSKRVHTPSTQLGWEVCGDFTFAPCSCLLFNVSYPQDGSPH